MKKNYYTIYNKNEEIIASGLADECAMQLNTNIKSFFSIISKNKTKRNTYTIISEKVEVNKKNEIIYNDE